MTQTVPNRAAAAGALVMMALSVTACGAAGNAVSKGVTRPMVAGVKALGSGIAALAGRGKVAIDDAFGRQLAAWTLNSEQRVVFKSFENALPRVRWRVVRRDVKEFVRAFEEGARAPSKYLSDPSADAALVNRWLGTPKHHRVFVAGTEKDTALIDQVRRQLEREGKTVFFYKFCSGQLNALCDSKTVGAFFGTAGTAVLAFSEATAGSRFIPHEVAAAHRIAAGQSELVIMTPGEALFQGAQTSVVRGTVESGGPAGQ